MERHWTTTQEHIVDRLVELALEEMEDGSGDRLVTIDPEMANTGRVRVIEGFEVVRTLVYNFQAAGFGFVTEERGHRPEQLVWHTYGAGRGEVSAEGAIEAAVAYLIQDLVDPTL